MVFMRDGRAEQDHDAVASVLINGTFEAMHGIGRDREVTFEQLMPLLGIELGRKLHRALDIGEEHRDLFALAFER